MNVSGGLGSRFPKSQQETSRAQRQNGSVSQRCTQKVHFVALLCPAESLPEWEREWDAQTRRLEGGPLPSRSVVFFFIAVVIFRSRPMTSKLIDFAIPEPRHRHRRRRRVVPFMDSWNLFWVFCFI